MLVLLYDLGMQASAREHNIPTLVRTPLVALAALASPAVGRQLVAIHAPAAHTAAAVAVSSSWRPHEMPLMLRNQAVVATGLRHTCWMWFAGIFYRKFRFTFLVNLIVPTIAVIVDVSTHGICRIVVVSEISPASHQRLILHSLQVSLISWRTNWLSVLLRDGILFAIYCGFAVVITPQTTDAFTRVRHSFPASVFE